MILPKQVEEKTLVDLKEKTRKIFEAAHVEKLKEVND